MSAAARLFSFRCGRQGGSVSSSGSAALPLETTLVHAYVGRHSRCHRCFAWRNRICFHGLEYAEMCRSNWFSCLSVKGAWETGLTRSVTFQPQNGNGIRGKRVGECGLDVRHGRGDRNDAGGVVN